MTIVRLAVAAVTMVGVSGCGGSEGRTWARECQGSPRPQVVWNQCNLRDADLRGADLTGALLHNVDLAGADLAGSNLYNASLSHVYAADANLRDANLEGALVNGGNIQKALFCNTTMPDGKVANSDC